MRTLNNGIQTLKHNRLFIIESYIQPNYKTTKLVLGKLNSLTFLSLKPILMGSSSLKVVSGTLDRLRHIFLKPVLMRSSSGGMYLSR